MEYVQKCSRTFLFFKQNKEPTTLLLASAPDQIHPDQEEGPGGKVEPGETTYEAAIREVWEETGIKIHSSPEDFFYCGDSYFENHLGKFQESFFLLKLSDQINQVICSKEHHLFRTVPYSQFFNAKFHPGVRTFLLTHKEKIDQWITNNFLSQ